MERVVETEVCGYVLVFDELTGFIGVALLQRRLFAVFIVQQDICRAYCTFKFYLFGSVPSSNRTVHKGELRGARGTFQ